MRQTILLFSTFILLAATALAQDAKQAIRDHYAAAKAYITQIQQLERDDDIYPVPQYFRTTEKQNLPGTGYHERETLMYYREQTDSDGQIYPDLYLDFATRKYNYAASQYYEEYLYDAQGRVEFIYGSEPDIIEDITTEYRFYFHNGRLIDVIIKTRPLGTTTDAKTVYTGRSVPKQYHDYYNARCLSAKSILDIFTAIDNS